MKTLKLRCVNGYHYRFWLEIREDNIVDIVDIDTKMVDKFLLKYHVSASNLNQGLIQKLYEEWLSSKKPPKTEITTIQKL